jgi:hypothetical protein
MLYRSLRLRGGSDGNPAAPAGWHPPSPQAFQQQQQQQQQQQHEKQPGAPHPGLQTVPSAEEGFVDNGVPYSEQFAAMLQQRRRAGHDIPVPTPEMFAGVEGVSFDAKGNFQLGELVRGL